MIYRHQTPRVFVCITQSPLFVCDALSSINQNISKPFKTFVFVANLPNFHGIARHLGDPKNRQQNGKC